MSIAHKTSYQFKKTRVKRCFP